MRADRREPTIGPAQLHNDDAQAFEPAGEPLPRRTDTVRLAERDPLLPPDDKESFERWLQVEKLKAEHEKNDIEREKLRLARAPLTRFGPLIVPLLAVVLTGLVTFLIARLQTVLTKVSQAAQTQTEAVGRQVEGLQTALTTIGGANQQQAEKFQTALDALSASNREEAAAIRMAVGRLAATNQEAAADQGHGPAPTTATQPQPGSTAPAPGPRKPQYNDLSISIFARTSSNLELAQQVQDWLRSHGAKANLYSGRFLYLGEGSQEYNTFYYGNSESLRELISIADDLEKNIHDFGPSRFIQYGEGHLDNGYGWPFFGQITLQLRETAKVP